MGAQHFGAQTPANTAPETVRQFAQMFFSDSILTRKGPLANIWIAAHWERRLTKAQVVATDIGASVRDIVSGALPAMALRLSGQLLLGAAKIYSRKARYLLDDCAEALDKMRVSFAAAVDEHGSSSADAPPATRAAYAAITLPAGSSAGPARSDDAEPELDLDALLRGSPARPSGVPAAFARPSAAFALETMRDSDIPSELHVVPSPEDARLVPLGSSFADSPGSVEVGRRATLSSLASPAELMASGAPPGGKSSLPFSPLRESAAHLGGSVFDDEPFDDNAFPLNDDGAVFDNDVPPPPVSDGLVPDDVQPVPPARAGRTRNTARPRRAAPGTRRRAVHLDTQTELDAAAVQRQVAETSAIVASEADVLDAAPVDDAVLASAIDTLSIAPALDDHIGPRTPKSPRISLPPEHLADDGFLHEDVFGDDQAPVSDYGNDALVPEAPVVVPTSSSAALDDGSADAALQSWDALFASSPKHALPLSSLVAKPARRRQAAEAFLNVLVLHTRGLVRASQDVPYGPISVVRVC